MESAIEYNLQMFEWFVLGYGFQTSNIVAEYLFFLALVVFKVENPIT